MPAPFDFARATQLLPDAQRRIGRVRALVNELRDVQRRVDLGRHDTATMTMTRDLEERVSDELAWFHEHGIQLKGLEPALLDFPARARLDGVDIDVLLCWREDEPAIAWYHPVETGYAGREPIAQLEAV